MTPSRWKKLNAAIVACKRYERLRACSSGVNLLDNHLDPYSSSGFFLNLPPAKFGRSNFHDIGMGPVTFP